MGKSGGQSGLEFRNSCAGSATSRRPAGRTWVLRNPCVSRRIGCNGVLEGFHREQLHDETARAILEDTSSTGIHWIHHIRSHNTMRLVCFAEGAGKSGPADAASADAACLQPSQHFGSAGGTGCSCQVSSEGTRLGRSHCRAGLPTAVAKPIIFSKPEPGRCIGFSCSCWCLPRRVRGIFPSCSVLQVAQQCRSSVGCEIFVFPCTCDV